MSLQHGLNEDDSALHLHSLQQQVLTRISELECEIESLKSCQDPDLAIPSPSTTVTIEELRALNSQFHSQELVPRIQQLEDEIQTLTASIYSYTSIHHLPVEVLSTIFQLVTLDPLPQAPWLEGHRPLASVKLTHVCRRWRAAAMECMALWSVIDLSCPRMAEVILGRGRNALLTVLWSWHSVRLLDQAGPILVKLLSQDLHRIRHFISCGNLPLAHPIRSAPALETFAIQVAKNPPLNALLQGPFPNIRRLEVDSCDIAWSCLPLSSTLTHLEVRGSRETDVPRNPLHSLRGLRSLQRMDLCRSLPSPRHAGPVGDLVPVSLHSLRYANITDWSASMSDFLRLVYIPIEANISLYCDADPQEDDALAALTRLVDDVRVSNGVEPGVQRNIISLRLTEETCDVHHQSTPGDMSLLSISNVGTSDFHRWVDTAELLDMLTIRFNISSLTSLVMDEFFGMLDDRTWRHFATLPNLKDITLCQTSPVDLIELLEQKSAPSRHGPPGFPFPSLLTIELVDLDEDGIELDMEECTRRLIRICKKRVRASRPLARLQIEECGCFEFEHIERIRKSVPSLSVVWDGYSYESE